jgi:hypothetical protein
MLRSSLFRRLTRYAGRENRLTEALAGVLERTDDAVAWELAREWVDPDSPKDAGERAAPTGSVHRALEEARRLVSVSTQVRTPLHKRPDLELRFGSGDRASATDVLLRVEVKHHGTQPHDQQLENYWSERPDVREFAVVLLAPRSSLPDELAPSWIPQRAWERTAAIISRTAPAMKRDPDRAVASFLLEELYDYMRSENLTDPEAVLPEHLVTFAYVEEAKAALARVCSEVSATLATDRRRRPDSRELYRQDERKPAYGYNYWEAWNIPKDWPGSDYCWLDWNARREPGHQEAKGRGLFFLSGLAADLGVPFGTTPAEQAWHAQLEAGVNVTGSVIRFVRITDECERLARVAYPEEVLIGRTLPEQAATLARWITDGFTAIETALTQSSD